MKVEIYKPGSAVMLEPDDPRWEVGVAGEPLHYEEDDDSDLDLYKVAAIEPEMRSSWREKAALAFVGCWTVVAFIWGSWVMMGAIHELVRHLLR